MLSIVKCSALRSLSQLRRICGSDCAKFDYSSIKRFSASVRLRNEFLAERVDTRSLVKLSGEDAPNFLQGLITNDIRLFENSQQDMLIYCMLLNTQGRVLYDLLVYRVSKFFEKDKSVILECDSRASDDVIKTLSRYKLRRKAVSFFKLEEYRVWSAFPKSSMLANTDSKLPLSNSKNVLFHSLDPRILSFGHRLILPTEIKGSEVISNSTDAEEQYHSRRFDFGLSEGIQEHIPGQSFPLECNLFFLNGVSFSKGCYVGQELTTRTHHTGVVRKRIMPIFSRSPIAMDTSKGEGHVIVCEAKEKECGKVLAWRSCRGLALLRLQEALLSPGPLLIKDARGTILGRVETLVPNWWPADADEVIKKVRSKQERL